MFRSVLAILCCLLAITPPVMALDEQTERKRLALIALELDRVIRVSRQLAREVGQPDSRLRMVYRDLKTADGRIWRAGLVDDLTRVRAGIARYVEQRVDLLDTSRPQGHPYGQQTD